MLLALIIDDTIVNYVWATIAVAIPSLVTTVVVLFRKLIAFSKPLILETVESHRGLVKKMEENVPIVGTILTKLGENQEQICSTQDKQCETLDQHGRLLEKHSETMETILVEVRCKKSTVA